MCNIRSNSHAAFDSDLPAGFPATVGACQTTNHGGNDAFVSKQNATGSMLLYSTYLGGTNPDTGTAIAVDSAGNAYVTGSTESIDFPTTANAIQPISGGPNAFGTGDAFVTVLNPQGNGLVYSSYFGGSDNDVGAGITLDTSFSAYVTGSTASTNFPTTSSAFQTTYGGGLYDAFVTKIASTVCTQKEDDDDRDDHDRHGERDDHQRHNDTHKAKSHPCKGYDEMESEKRDSEKEENETIQSESTLSSQRVHVSYLPAWAVVFVARKNDMEEERMIHQCQPAVVVRLVMLTVSLGIAVSLTAPPAPADSIVTVTGTLPTTDTFGLTINADNVVSSNNNLLASRVLTGLSGAFSTQFTVVGSTVPNGVLIAGQASSSGLLSCGFSTATGSLSGYSFLPYCPIFGGFTTQANGSLVATFNIWEAASTVIGPTGGNGNGTPVLIGSGTVTITQAAAVAAAQRAYVANFDDGSVSVINTATNQVVGSPIAVGNNPLYLALTPNGRSLYVVNVFDPSVSVINTKTNTVVATVPLGTAGVSLANGVAITPDGKFAYVATVSPDGVSIIDTSANTVVNTITAGFPAGAAPMGLAITPDGQSVYVADNGNASVSVINTNTNTVVKTIPVESTPEDVAISPDGEFAWVTNNGNTTVSVINTDSNMVVNTITVGSGPDGAAFTRCTDFAYVTNEGSHSISVIDTETDTVATTITLPAGTFPDGVAFTSNGRFAYVTNQNDPGSIFVINTGTNMVTQTITAGVRGSPSGIVISTRKTETEED